MPLGKLWAGRAFGTSTGNLFVRLEGEDSNLAGTLRLNESGVPLVVYAITGAFDGKTLTLIGEPQHDIEGVQLGSLTARASINPRGELIGEWETTIGSAGTFQLFPHDQAHIASTSGQITDQLHTARHNFGAIEIDRDQIIALAEEIQRDFALARVVVSHLTEGKLVSHMGLSTG